MNKIIYSAIAVLGLTVGACSDNYLDNNSPNPGPDDLFATTEAAQYAVNGLGRLQMNQMIGTQGFSGEGGMLVWYGEFPGNDLVHNRWNSTWYNWANLNYLENFNHNHNRYAWIYNYKIIANANAIINSIDNAEGPDDEKKFIKAEALTFRAHAYTWLVQTYCRRWVDSNSGKSRGVVLRTGNEPSDYPCATLADSYAFIYKDLDEAIRLFNESSKKRGTGENDRWLPNVDVAHAIYARAALARNDWNTANDQAALARANYPLMTSDQYREGFNTPNSEWIWMAYNDNTQTLSYYGPHAYLSSNGAGTVTRSYGNIISKQLIDQIPEEDSRRWLYGIPREDEDNKINTTSKPGNITKGPLLNRYKGEYYDRYCHTNTMRYYAYAVMKFLSLPGTIADGCFVTYRSAEMYYTQAEALYELGKEKDARDLLIEAVKPYNPDYTCTLSGEALRDEIRLYRRFDLLGEGHNFYDFKRWKLPIERKDWANGGTWPAVFCGKGELSGNFGPNDKNNWCFSIPLGETNYNKCVNYNVEPDNWDQQKEINAGKNGDDTNKQD